MKLVAAFAVALPLMAGAVQASTIERACLGSERQASRALCHCIQQAADATLTRGDQRRAASFFADPHQAQVTRMSGSPADESFWRSYLNFSRTAQAYCRG